VKRQGESVLLKPGHTGGVPLAMTLRALLIWGLVLLAITLFSIFLLDAAAANALSVGSSGLKTAASGFTTATEVVFGFEISKWLSGMVIVFAGLLLMIKRRDLGKLVVFIGVTQLAARLIAGVLKNVFLRPRPFEGVTRSLDFFTDGSSFPSGHAAHFWPFFFAVAIAFPKWRWPFLALAVAISIARVVVNDHYVSDVTASAAISAFVVYLGARAFVIRTSK
jgi:membrane-associated phospholipid phosphatase